MEKYSGGIVDDKLIECDGQIIFCHDLETCINNYLSTLYNPDDIYNKTSKSFNGLLLYLYRHLIYKVIPDKYNYNYELLDDIFNYIYIPLTYRYNRVPSINMFCVLVGVDYSYFYDIKSGTYKNTGYIVNNKTISIIKKWINYCNSELIEDVVTTNSIGSIFRAKVHGFREDNNNNITININTPQLSEQQLKQLAAGSIAPTLPDNEV